MATECVLILSAAFLQTNVHEGWINIESEESNVIFVQKSLVGLLSVVTIYLDVCTSENYAHGVLATTFLVCVCDRERKGISLIVLMIHSL